VVSEQETVAVRTVIAYLETEGGAVTSPSASAEKKKVAPQQQKETPAPSATKAARVEVVMPQMGESIAEGTIVKWHKKVGDKVKKDETLLEISTDKVDSEIPSPAGGVLSEILVQEQQTVAIRTVIAYLTAEGGSGAPALASDPKQASPPPITQVAKPTLITTAVTQQQMEKPVSGRFYSPLVLTIARTEGVGMEELERIPGSGENGRVTKKDMLGYVEARKAGTIDSGSSMAASPPKATSTGIIAKPVEVPELRQRYPAPQHDILQMTNVLQKMASHMVKSIQTSPHVAAIHEVDMTMVARHRTAHAAEFEKREGFKLTFMPYIVDGVMRAIKKFPLVNCSIEGDKIIKKNFINIGIAVAAENGLIVPVIRNADERNFLGLARAVNDLAVRTRTKKLTPDDIQGGTFTISNYGVFGTLVGTPIINQPQVAILGTGAIKKQVAVMNDAIAIRSKAFFTLSFDHRIIDGALAGTFMEEVVRYLENFNLSTKV
ncbi:MAG TPA: dihydrolipoamide acetyltransferase family protein, partial [Bacteroidota bacterium]